MLTVGGWYDLEDPVGPLKVAREIGRHNPGIYNGLVMGPWAHGAWLGYDGVRIAHVDFGAKTAQAYRKNILVPFFETHLKDQPGPKLAAAHVFETGTNVWRQYAQWPPAAAQPGTLYLQAGGRLGWSHDADRGHDEYVSDPAKLVPYTATITLSVPQTFVSIPQARSSDFVKATQCVFHGGPGGSAIGVQVLANPAAR